MGLDMYLYTHDHEAYPFKPRELPPLEQVIEGTGMIVLVKQQVTTEQWLEDYDVWCARYRPCYWRKANEIHAWFVKHVQNGVDECEPHPVRGEQLEKLYRSCKEVLANPCMAQVLLPTQGGFFFGNTDYDCYYLQSLQNTVNMLDAMRPFAPEGYIYQSSW